MRRRGVTASRTNPRNRAHAFRMTLVVQGNKLPQINFKVKVEFINFEVKVESKSKVEVKVQL